MTKYRETNTICRIIERCLLTHKCNSAEVSEVYFRLYCISVCCRVYRCTFSMCVGTVLSMYRGADMSLARPGRKQATATEYFDVHISYVFIIIIGGILILFIYKKTIIKRNILTIKQNTSWSRSGKKLISTPVRSQLRSRFLNWGRRSLTSTNPTLQDHKLCPICPATVRWNRNGGWGGGGG